MAWGGRSSGKELARVAVVPQMRSERVTVDITTHGPAWSGEDQRENFVRQ